MKAIQLTLKVLIVIVLIYCGFSVIAQDQNHPLRQISNVDLSTPEQCVHRFYEAFRTGSAELLSRVLIEGGSYAAFSPQYNIDKPSRVISGAEIAGKTVIKKWGGFGEPVDAGDVLVYVVTKKDPQLIARKPGVAMPDEKFCFLVRKINNQWKLVKVYANWPTLPGQ